MDYQIVTLKERYIRGRSVRTNNSDSDLSEKIGSLWGWLYAQNGIEQIEGRTNENTYGLYTNYESDFRGDYDAAAGCEVNRLSESQVNLVDIKIPAGQYAKFSIIADMPKGSVALAWDRIWQMKLDRAYTVDFEEYLPSGDLSKVPVNIYIALQ